MQNLLRGRYLGANLGIITSPAVKSWWGEGEVKIYLDGDGDLPTLCGTGTEDYICTAYSTGTFSLPWYGCRFLSSPDPDRTLVSLYRFHGTDPVYFSGDCRVTVQQIGLTDAKADPLQLALYGEKGVVLAGDGSNFLPIAEFAESGDNKLFERQEDWCATGYVYLDRPAVERDPLPPFSERVADLLPPPDPMERRNARLRRAVRILPRLGNFEEVVRELPQEIFCKVAAGWECEAAWLCAQLPLESDGTSERDHSKQQAQTKGLLDPAYFSGLAEQLRRHTKVLGAPMVLCRFQACKLAPPTRLPSINSGGLGAEPPDLGMGKHSVRKDWLLVVQASTLKS